MHSYKHGMCIIVHVHTGSSIVSNKRVIHMQFVHPKWQKMLPLASSTAAAQPVSQSVKQAATTPLFYGGGQGQQIPAAKRQHNNKLSTVEQLNEITSANREAPTTTTTRRRMDGACRSLLCIALQWVFLTTAYISSSIAFPTSFAVGTSEYVHFLNVQFHWNPFTSLRKSEQGLLAGSPYDKLSHSMRRRRRMVRAFTNK